MEKRLLQIAMLLMLAFLGGSPALAAPDPLGPAANQAFLADNAKRPGVMVRPSGLQYRILRSGFGKRVALGDTVQLQYSASLINGAVVDGSSPGLPTILSVANLIRGMSEALQLMRVGDRWQLVVPPNLAFGDKGTGTAVPPGQVMVFDVTLVGATTPSGPVQNDPGLSLSPMNRQEGRIQERGMILSIPQ